MALLERVATLLRANLNDLIDRAEDPQKMLRQLILDMENQLLQVKTQVAIALADQHLLEKKQAEHEESAGNWKRKAALAVTRQQDDLARAALRQQISHQQMAASFAQQLSDQRAETETLRTALGRLQQRLQETQSRCELLAVEHRRARASQKLTAWRPQRVGHHGPRTRPHRSGSRCWPGTTYASRRRDRHESRRPERGRARRALRRDGARGPDRRSSARPQGSARPAAQAAQPGVSARSALSLYTRMVQAAPYHLCGRGLTDILPHELASNLFAGSRSHRRAILS